MIWIGLFFIVLIVFEYNSHGKHDPIPVLIDHLVNIFLSIIVVFLFYAVHNTFIDLASHINFEGILK